MEESIVRANIQVGCITARWEDAIRVAAKPLVERGSISEGYIGRMVDSVNNLGPYIVIMPGFALAHAAPGDDVCASDLSLAKFIEPIDFGSDKGPVSIVMCLACTDRQAHISRLSKIAERLLDETILERMLACEDADELYALING